MTSAFHWRKWLYGIRFRSHLNMMETYKMSKLFSGKDTVPSMRISRWRILKNYVKQDQKQILSFTQNAVGKSLVNQIMMGLQNILSKQQKTQKQAQVETLEPRSIMLIDSETNSRRKI